MLNTADATSTGFVRLLPPDLGRRIVLAKGEHVFAADDPTRGLFQVETGLVRLVRHAIDGSEITLHVARTGDMFAEASLFADRYHCDALAEQPSTVLTFDKERVLAALASEPALARTCIEHLSRQVQTLRAQAACLSLRSADERVLSFLRIQCTGTPNVTLDRPWKAIASELGLTHEALYRTLARLERRGVIKRNRDRSTVELTTDRSR